MEIDSVLPRVICVWPEFWCSPRLCQALASAYQYLHEHLQKAAHDAPEPVDATGATLVSAIPAGHP